MFTGAYLVYGSSPPPPHTYIFSVCAIKPTETTPGTYKIDAPPLFRTLSEYVAHNANYIIMPNPKEWENKFIDSNVVHLYHKWCVIFSMGYIPCPLGFSDIPAIEMTKTELLEKHVLLMERIVDLSDLESAPVMNVLDKAFEKFHSHGFVAHPFQNITTMVEITDIKCFNAKNTGKPGILISMIDNKGNVLKTFQNIGHLVSIGGQYKIDAVVSKHNTWNTKRETIIKNVVVDDK